MAISVLIKLHRWLGLTLGLWLVLVALTGTLLLYRVELLQLTYPQLQLPQWPSQQQTALVLDQYTEGYAYMPREANPWLEIVLPDGARHYYNAHGERVLERPYLGDFVSIMVAFHHHLLLDELGKDLLGWLGLGALMIAITGIIRWWPKHWSRRLVKIRWQWPWQRGFAGTLFQLHKVAGSLLFVPLIVGLATGTAIMYAGAVSKTLELVFPQQQSAPYQPAPLAADIKATTWQQRFDVTAMLYPDLTPQLISMSNHSVRLTYPGEWHPNGRSSVTFDAQTGAVLKSYDVRNATLGYALSQMVYPVHVAAIGGVSWLVVVLIGGIALMVLPLSGIYFWCWRQYRKRCNL